MAKRPFIQKSAADIDAIFKTQGGDPAILRALAHELKFRSTQAARRLETRVRAALDRDATGASGAPGPQPRKPAASAPASPAQVPQRPDQPSLPLSDPEPPNHGRFSAPAATSSLAQPADSMPSPAPLQAAAPAGSKPALTNDPEAILRAWTALEVLSPATIRKWTSLNVRGSRQVVRLDDGKLPWDGGAKAIPGKKVVFEVFLGTIGMARAIESLLKVYADTRPERPATSGYAILASVLVDKNGCPFEEQETLAVSSFGWGVPVALQGDLTALGHWPDAERRLKQELQKRITRRNSEGEIRPLTQATLDGAYRHIVKELGLAGQDLNGPDYALRRYEFFANKQPPEPSLLNSFYLGDLERARGLFTAGRAPATLQLYLGQAAPAHRLDLLEDREALRDILRPANTPLGRWPAPGRNPLVLLQQAAVNGTVRELNETGILAVNGPPGTGKTTLLRDVVVAPIVERAEAMARLDDPATAFRKSGETVQRQGATLNLSQLDAALRGFEMVVASSNNKAVENVSAELPGLGAIADDAPDLRSFKSVSDRVLQRDTWGMIAAVLGNSANRYSFAEAYWRDPEHGMATYLNHAAGTPQVEAVRGEDGSITYRTRQVVLDEAPPRDRSEALRRWKAARAAFLAALALCRKQQAEFDAIHQALFVPSRAEADLARDRVDLSPLQEQRRDVDLRLIEANKALNRCQEGLDQLNRYLAQLQANAPGLLAQLFRRRATAEWRQQRTAARANSDAARRALAAAQDHIGKLQSTAMQTDQQGEHLRRRIEALEADLARQHLARENARSHPAQLPDDGFFSLGHRERQMSTLWFDDKAQRLRDDLFTAAMNLHRAFLDAAADPIRQNLAILMESFGTKSLGSAGKDRLIEDLWATFFLAVPVVSTTFASVERMFLRLGPRAIGWLLIDEAGQALPQAAVGALMRARRAVVVGDPLQIQPVVVLPKTLTEEICGQFGVSAERFNAPEASVQTVADRASPYCARFAAGSGHRDVGLPLLVHRRCDSPMFDISNTIAYANLMVQAKPSPTDLPPLGPSRWIDVRGQSDNDKWSEAEGREVLALLSQLRASGRPADLYIVTPFVVVQDNLRRLLSDSGALTGWVENPPHWVNDHVGTVHTVQGREAQSVIFVLGAPSPSQRGARAWAGGNPNLLNVAVTRAKHGLYVVGNRSLWSEAGVFRELDRLLR